MSAERFVERRRNSRGLSFEQKVKAHRRQLQRMRAQRELRDFLAQIPQRDIPSAVIYTFPLIGLRTRSAA